MIDTSLYAQTRAFYSPKKPEAVPWTRSHKGEKWSKFYEGWFKAGKVI